MRAVGAGVVHPDTSVGRGVVVVKILSAAAAGELVGVGELFLFRAVNLYLVKGCGTFRIVVQVVDVIANQGRIQARVGVKDREVFAVSVNPAEAVVVERKETLIQR
jgi:hypothetical protein